MNKTAAKFLAAGAAIALSLISPTAAHATGAPTLPSGDHLYAIDCGGPVGNIFELDATDGSATVVHNQDLSSDVSCPAGAQYNHVDHMVYYLAQNQNWSGWGLYKLDPTDWSTTLIGNINGIDDLWNILIDNSGNAYVTAGDSLYSISLTDASVTLVGAGNGLPVGGSVRMRFGGYDFKNSTAYIETGIGDASGYYTVDLTTGVASANLGLIDESAMVTNHDLSTDYMDMDNPMTFDSNGNAWVSSDGGYGAQLIAWNPTTNIVSPIGQLWETAGTVYPDTHYFYSRTFFVIPADVVPPVDNRGGLAHTGIDTTLYAYIAGGLLLVGYVTRKIFNRR